MKIQELTNKCQEEEIDFEIKSTCWEDPQNGKWNENGRREGKVLFSMKNIWWPQENTINPFREGVKKTDGRYQGRLKRRS